MALQASQARDEALTGLLEPRYTGTKLRLLHADASERSTVPTI